MPIRFETTEPWAFVEDDHPNKNNNRKNNKMSSDMGSIPDPKCNT